MSIIPEILIQRTLRAGLESFRKDPRTIDSLFKNLSQATVTRIKDLVLNQSIGFYVNYPRQDLTIPSFVLILKNESEGQSWLGDLAGASPHYNMPDQDMAIDTLGGHGASTSTMRGLPEKEFGPFGPEAITLHEALDDPSTIERTRVVFRSDTAASFAECIWEPKKGQLGPLNAHVVQGAGAGKVYQVIDIDPEGFDIAGTFVPQLDSSSLIDLRSVDDTGLAVGEPSRVYPVDATNIVRRGSNYDVTYQLHVVAGHQEEVLFLYSIAKALLLSQKRFLEEQGIIALKLSGTDFSPKSEYLPSEVFTRVLMLQFVSPFYFLDEIEVAKRIQFTVMARDPRDPYEDCTSIVLDVDLPED
jgi:hypothetical protein